MARYVVDVMPKREILDPQGKAVLGALPRLGFQGVTDVRHEAGPSSDWPVKTLAAEGKRFREYRHAP